MKRQSGLTLLELLVVLILVGLLSTLLMQGFGYMFSVYSRVTELQQDNRQTTLMRAWFTNSVSSVSPQLDSERYFSGDETSLKGVTIQPLARESGVPTLFEWRLTQEDGWITLEYREELGTVWQVDRWRSEQAGFRYMDENREWHQTWPVPDGLSNIVPKAVEFSSTRKRERFRIVVPTQLFVYPKEDYREKLFEN